MDRTRRLVALGVCALLALLAPGAIAKPKEPKPDRVFTFADVAWYTPGAEALRQVAAKGYRGIPGTKDAVVAQGKTFDHLSVARGILDDSARVVRWEISMIAQSQDDRFREMKPIYDQIVTECTQRYGDPWDAAEKYKFPYDKADGRETDALHDGKAMIHAIWRGTRAGDRLTVEMDPEASVVLTYTCPGWERFQDRVRHRKARDF